MLMEYELNCPVCGHDLSCLSACSNCGLWWTDPEHCCELIENSELFNQTLDSFHTNLREPIPFIFLGVLLFFGSCGYGASLAVVSAIVHHSESLFAWLGLIMALPLGLFLGTYCFGAIFRIFLHAIMPSKLVGEEHTLKLRVWNTWGGLWDGFRQVKADVPRNQLTGVVFSRGQGGDWQLFILHSSGLALGTGWSGRTKTDALNMSVSLLTWIKANHE